jgi:hypothetical protein
MNLYGTSLGHIDTPGPGRVDDFDVTESVS